MHDFPADIDASSPGYSAIPKSIDMDAVGRIGRMLTRSKLLNEHVSPLRARCDFARRLWSQPVLPIGFSDQLDVHDFGFELVDQILNRLAAWLTMNDPPVVDQLPPMLNRVSMHRTTPPAPGARNRRKEV
jgi:hypothetical protein